MTIEGYIKSFLPFIAAWFKRLFFVLASGQVMVAAAGRGASRAAGSMGKLPVLLQLPNQIPHVKDFKFLC